MKETAWHSTDIDATLQELKTDTKTGPDDREAKKCPEEYVYNE